MAFRATIKVCFSDIDNAGIVYYPRFIHYFHLTMEEFFRNVMGIDFSAVLHERNVACPTVHLECDFRRRLKYGDTIEIDIDSRSIDVELSATEMKKRMRGFKPPKKPAPGMLRRYREMAKSAADGAGTN